MSQEGIHQFLELLEKKEREQLIFYSFKMFDREGRGRINKKAFCDFVEGAWLSAGGVLAKQCKAEEKAIRQWCENARGKLRAATGRVYDGLRPKPEGIDKQEFRLWVLKEECKSVTVELGSSRGVMPLHLVALTEM
jgi:hypothetical protein